MAFDAASPAKTAKPLLGYTCCACREVTHLSDLNDDMLCEACAGPAEVRTWVPRRELLEG